MCIIHHCLITENNFHRENGQVKVCIDPNIQNVLRIFIHRLTVFVKALNFTSNICSQVIIHGDKTVSKLYRK